METLSLDFNLFLNIFLKYQNMQHQGNNKKPKIVLISLYLYESVGVRSLYSILKEGGFDVYTIFFKKLIFNKMADPTEKEKRLLLDQLKELGPSIIGLSVRSPFFNIARDLTEKIKNELKTAVVCWGGIHPTICPEECIKYADIVCIGEGEKPFLELATKIQQGEDITQTAGFWIKQGNHIIKIVPPPFNQNLDSLPLPDYENSNKYFINDGELKEGDPILSSSSYELMASRGCPFQCTYCINSVLKDMFGDKGPFIRRRSVKHVIDELIQAKKYFKNLKRIYFLDEVFVLDRRWLKKFVKEYKTRINLPFSCEFYPTTVNEETISLLKKAGLSKITMGIQSGSERIRNQIYQRFSPTKDILEAVRILKKYKISSSYDIILDNPMEKETDFSETLDLLLKIPRPFDLHLYSLINFPQTKLTKKLINDGIIKGEESIKALGQWRMSFDYERDRKNLFWNSLIFLTSKNYVPKQLIRLLSKSNFLKFHPSFLASTCRIFNILELNMRRLRLLIKGRYSFCEFLVYFKKKLI